MKSMNSWAGFLVCVAISTVATISIDDCPGNPQLDRYLRAFGDSCYEFVLDHTREWPTAESECRRRNGHLAVIRDAATNQFLHDTLQELMLYDGMVFIGLTDSDTEGHWVWVDGSEASYTNWAPDRPSDASSTENCAAINSGDGLWHDYFCESALFFHNDNKFICEYPIETRNATTAEAPTQTGITTTTTDVVTPTEVPTTDFLTTGVPATSELPPTTTIVAGDTPCPLFQCALDCGLNGYDVTDMGCMLCQCAK